MWEIIFYERHNGRCPVKEFLAELSLKADLPFIENKLDLLAEYGRDLKRPHIAYLRDDIWELRVETRSGQFRFFHFYFAGRTIVITHGYHKKSDKVAGSEIDKAIEYRKDYLVTQRGQRR
jgi:phage-related protein